MHIWCVWIISNGKMKCCEMNFLFTLKAHNILLLIYFMEINSTVFTDLPTKRPLPLSRSKAKGRILAVNTSPKIGLAGTQKYFETVGFMESQIHKIEPKWPSFCLIPWFGHKLSRNIWAQFSKLIKTKAQWLGLKMFSIFINIWWVCIIPFYLNLQTKTKWTILHITSYPLKISLRIFQ